MCHPENPVKTNVNKPIKIKNLIPNVHPTNSLILPDGKIFKVQKKRQRKILSCIPCHQRKIKCARETPTCSNCQLLADKNPSKLDEILGACKYFDNDKRKNLQRQGLQLDLTNQNISEKSDTKLRDKTQDEESNSSIKDDESDSVKPIKSPTDTNFYRPESFDYLMSNENLDENKSFNLPEEEISHTPTQYQKGINYQSIPDSRAQYDLIFPIRNESQASSSISDFEIYSQYSKQFSNEFVIFIENLPSKERSDELVKIFEENIHSVLPIIDLKNFKKKYEEFWYCGLFIRDNLERLYEYVVYFKDKYESVPERISDFLYWYSKTEGNLVPSNLLEFCTLLYAIYYASLASVVYEYLPTAQSSIDSIITYKDEVNQYYSIFQKLNDKWLNHPKVMSLSILQMNVLIQSITNLKAGRSLINVSKILRICQFYQMNRDPVIFHGLKNKELVQARRLIWWQTFLLDNLISFFLNLSPLIRLDDFDTSLLIENLDKSTNCTMMYLNCQYRFILIMDSLNSLVNGLNVELKAEHINNFKNKINDLYITCNSTINKINDEYKKEPLNKQQSFDTYKYFALSMNLLSDKILIMLQKKIILNPYFASNNNEPHINLNLTLNSLHYNYIDLLNSLLPALLHYIHLFLGLSTKNMMKFNWKIKNYIPIDELILLMQILAVNINNGHSQQNDNNFKDFNMKMFLIDQLIISFVNTWHMKLSSVNKLIGLVSKIWRIMILKNNLNIDYARSISNEFVYPTPINTSEIDLNDKSPNIDDLSGVNCANIAPRSLRMASAVSNNANVYFTPSSINDYFQITDTSLALFNKNQSFNESSNSADEKLKEIEQLSTSIEEELNNALGSPDKYKTNPCNDDGWTNLGTEESTNVSIDDFHFYKNLKTDVLRLFELTR